MGYDAMANGGSAPTAAVAAGKKKRGNKKLKQCKLDARREQWLSQVKDNEAKKMVKSGTGSPVLSPLNQKHPHLHPLPMTLEEIEAEGVMHQMDAFDSPDHSPISNGSLHHASQMLCQGSSSGVSSGSSAWSSSRSVSDAEDATDRGREENDELDDWEAIADALSFDNTHEAQQESPLPIPSGVQTTSLEPVQPNTEAARNRPEPIQGKCRAWSPNDVFRPQSLPTLSKQVSFPARTEMCRGGTGREQNGVLSLQLSCPICCEDLDHTDSSFLPCPCGFRLCLFCHKRIIEADGRCPGCRKQYDMTPAEGGSSAAREAGMLAMRLSRSCSMGPKY